MVSHSVDCMLTSTVLLVSNKHCQYYSVQRWPDYMVSHGTAASPVDARMSPIILLLVK